MNVKKLGSVSLHYDDDDDDDDDVMKQREYSFNILGLLLFFAVNLVK
jgi:hypothetical protein